MEYLSTAILGLIQGITELLPISSSGHLVLASELMEISNDLLTLTSLHLASALALILIYWNEIKKILFSKGKFTFLCKLIMGMIPVVIAGVMIGDLLESTFYNYKFISLNLIFWGILMIITEIFESKLKRVQDEDISYKNALVMGVFQSLSLLPGTSRSGISTMAGIWSGASKDKALDFSFMMGIPLLFGAFFYSVIKDSGITNDNVEPSLIFAFIVTFISSYFAALLLRKYSKEKFLTLFGVYRIFLGVAVYGVFTYFL